MTKKSVEANNQRIVQAVRRIAKTAIEEDGRLSPANKKAAIGKTRGVAFYNSNGDIESNSGELPDEASTETPDDSDSQTKERNYKTITDDLEEGDKADEFEGYDCATGDKIQLDLAPMSGQEYQTPVGWDDANTPPDGAFVDDGTWDQGHYYYLTDRVLNGFNEVAPTKTEVCSANGLSFNGSGCERWNGFVYSISKASCSGSSPEDSMCDLSPAPESWPSDDITSLAVINGKFTASQYDPDAADGYKNNPPSRIEMCDGLGNRYEINALSNGNTMITKLQTDGSVDVLGQSLIINTNGVVKEKISNYTRDGLL